MGSGASIVNKSAVQITDSIKAIRLVTETQKNEQMVVYWFKAGSLYTDQYLKQQLKVVVDRMMRKRTSGALIRISTDIKGNDQEGALRLLRTFASQIEPLLERYIP
jgi:EpsI family protein